MGFKSLEVVPIVVIFSSGWEVWMKVDLLFSSFTCDGYHK